MNNNLYKKEFIEEITSRWISSKTIQKEKKHISSQIKFYFGYNTFDFKGFLKDKKLMEGIYKNLDNEILRKQYISYLKEFKGIFEEKKRIPDNLIGEFGLLLNNVMEYFFEARTYSNILNFVEKINKISMEFVIIDKGFETFLRRIGFSDKEIIEFLKVVTIENTKICNKKMEEFDKEEQAKKAIEEEKTLKKEELKRKKNVLSKKMSLELKEFLDGIKNMFEMINTDFSDELLNMALAYEDFLSSDISLNKENIKMIKDIDKCIFVLIWNEYNKIIKLKNQKTETDLNPNIEKIKTLYNNMLIIMEEDKKYEDSQAEDLVKPNEEIVIRYVIDDKNKISYFESAKNDSKGDSEFKKNADTIIDKMQKGLFVSKIKRPVDGIDNCYFVLQGLTYVSFLMLNDNSYIILTASKWDGLFSETRNIYYGNLEQINSLKKELVGDKYE